MGLRAVVVVPAHNEERPLPDCLAALARQTVGRDAIEVVLVADACSDATEQVALECAERFGLRMQVLIGPGAGSGPARRLGLDAAARRLLDLGHPGGLIATTDADSIPAPDWVARQLDHLDRGAQVVAGLIELDPLQAAALPEAVRRRRQRDASARLAQLNARHPEAEHHHFAGASLGVTAEVYELVGGLDPVQALEDEAFSARLDRHGIQVLHAADVRVHTSARSDGRALRGLSVDLAVSIWMERRRFGTEDFPLDLLAFAKQGTTVSVVIPTKLCAESVEGVLRETVAPLRERGLVDETIVIDAGSSDGTAACARAAGGECVEVVQQDEILSTFGPALGKGDAMWRALSATTGDIVCFLDGDTADPHPRHLQGLLGPLLTDPSIELVKGSFARPFSRGSVNLPHEGGRVTELMARPLLNLHEPRLAGFTQPLAGECAARRELLESLPFPVGYGVEIALLIDALRARGLDALAECHLGSRQNRHQPLRALGEMAFAVLAAVEQRFDPARSPTGGRYLRPWDDGTVVRVPIQERPPLAAQVQGDWERAIVRYQ